MDNLNAPALTQAQLEHAIGVWKRILRLQTGRDRSPVPRERARHSGGNGPVPLTLKKKSGVIKIPDPVDYGADNRWGIL